MEAFILVIPLSAIIFEDFKFRAIHWYWIVFLFILTAYFFPFNKGVILANATYIVFQVLVLSIYYSIKNKQWTNIINTYLGIGDVLFLIPLCLIFSLPNFMVFLIISFTVSLLIHSLTNLVRREKTQTIPLAGYMSIVLIIFLFFQYQYKISFSEHNFLLYLFN